MQTEISLTETLWSLGWYYGWHLGPYSNRWNIPFYGFPMKLIAMGDWNQI